jgi:hypothetical protein
VISVTQKRRLVFLTVVGGAIAAFLAIVPVVEVANGTWTVPDNGEAFALAR